MSQRRSKRVRKENPEVVHHVKQPPDKLHIITNVVIGIVLAAVIGAGAYAVGTKYMQDNQNSSVTDSSDQTDTDTQTQTVADAAAGEGISTEEYKTKYGLSSDLADDTSIGTAYQQMTLENLALATGKTVDEFRSENFVPDSVPNDMVWGEAMNELPLKAIVGEENVDQIKQTYGLGDDITAESKWGDVSPVLESRQQELSQAQENAANGESSDDTGESDSTDESAGE